MKVLGILTAAILALAVQSAQAQTPFVVTYADFSTRLVGKEFKSKISGVGVTARFLPDGSITVRALIGSIKGRWYFNEQQQICLSVNTSAYTDEGCSYLFDLGDGRTFQGDGGRLWVMKQ